MEMNQRSCVSAKESCSADVDRFLCSLRSMPRALCENLHPLLSGSHNQQRARKMPTSNHAGQAERRKLFSCCARYCSLDAATLLLTENGITPHNSASQS